MSDFQTLAGRVIADESFAQALLSSPETTLREAGVEPNPEILEALEGLNFEGIKKLAVAFGEDKAAAA